MADLSKLYAIDLNKLSPAARQSIEKTIALCEEANLVCERAESALTKLEATRRGLEETHNRLSPPERPNLTLVKGGKGRDDA